MSEQDDHDFGLVMPFVVCASEGGPYEDDAFAAGYECGLLDAVLAQRPVEVEQPVRSASLPLVDLIAMRHGFTLTAEAWDEHPDEWSHITLTRSNVDDQP